MEIPAFLDIQTNSVNLGNIHTPNTHFCPPKAMAFDSLTVKKPRFGEVLCDLIMFGISRLILVDLRGPTVALLSFHECD